jgi:tRNA A37 threonylcarbamoyltransferase TsaD
MLASENFSFSGLKTAVRYFWQKLRGRGERPAQTPYNLDEQTQRDSARLFSKPVIDVLVTKDNRGDAKISCWVS